MEVKKMEEFYSFTKEDLRDLVSLLKREVEMVKKEIPDGKEKRLLFFLRLVIDLFSDGDRSRKLKKLFEAKQMNKKKIIDDTFVKILEEWLEENGGNGNLMEVVKVFRSNGHPNLANLVERFLLRYSLPLSENGNSPGVGVKVYSSSLDFLRVKENKGVSMGSMPLWNANPMEQALQNSVILEEVFRKLDPGGQKMFRLVNPTWMKETFPYWRRSSVLQLHVPGNPNDAKIKGISMNSFVKLVDLDESARKLKEKPEDKHQLMEHPFHRYQLSYSYCNVDRPEEPFSCGKKEVKFWQLCGPHIEDLEIKNAIFGGVATENSVVDICEKILLDFCPKLKKFKISSSCRIEHFQDWQSSLVNKKKNADEKNGKVASKLHTLAVESKIWETDLRRILFLCPNLKVLNLRSRTWQPGEALLLPTSNGECLKLEKLIIKYSSENKYADKFPPLRDYTEMLVKNGLNCLQHLALEGFTLSDAKWPPFSLYAALGKLSQDLRTLELQMTLNGSEDKWFVDLSPFAFPNLTALKICFKSENQVKSDIQFDFGTLKGMPKLEQFEFRVDNGESFVRNPGTQDWVFTGNRNVYLPKGVTVDYFHSEEEPILCNNLKQFTFIGWSLNEEDIKLLSAWFPHLTRLKAAVELELVSFLLESLTGLEKLDLETKILISLADLIGFKEKKKGLRIWQTLSGRCPQTVEMKEHNGTLYFANENSE